MSVAIIGAGVAGLAAARRLRQLRPERAVTIFEKSHGFGGRVATRRRDGYLFDHGAQLFKTPTPALERLIHEELPAQGLRAVAPPVWIFDGAGAIAEGDPVLNQEAKWVYADGISRLGKLMAAGLDVQRETRVAGLEQRDHRGYRLFDPAGQTLGEADQVLLTPPAPQSAEILTASSLDLQLRDQLLAELARASYRRCLSLTLAYEQPLERPFFALVNVDRAHPIAWLALEHVKGVERCPAGQSLVTVQMAAAWSLANWELPAEQLTPTVAELASTLLGADLRQPLWGDRQGWRYALPDSSADFEALNATASGIYFAGDSYTELGRVHLAIEQGWRVAELIASTHAPR